MDTQKQGSRETIEDAISSSYREASRYCDGCLVIDRQGTIEFIDLGAQKILGVKRIDAEGSTLKVFLPDNVKPMHDSWVEKEFSKLQSALQNKTDYEGRFMGASPNSMKPRYLKAQSFDGNEISIGLEFQPLFWGKDNIGFVAFITKDPAAQIQERAIAQTSEARQVVKNAQAEMLLGYAERSGNLFARGHSWIRLNVFQDVPGSGFLSFFLEIGVICAISIGLWYVIPGLRKPPTIQQFNLGTGQESTPQSSP